MMGIPVIIGEMSMDKNNIYVLRDIDSFMSVTEAIREQGLTLENCIIEKKVIESNYYLSKQLNVPLATELFYLCRVRYVEGIAQSIEKTYIEYSKVKGIEEYNLENISFYGLLLKEYGIQICKTVEELLLVEAKREEKRLLGLEGKCEILLNRGTSFVSKKDREPFEYFEMSSLPSFYRYRSVTEI